ncbi:MAG: 3-keto-disaccharide hydrolase [Phycisphaerae bacterium]
MNRLLCSLCMVASLAGAAQAGNDVHFVDGEIRFQNRRLEIWGAQVPDWQRLVTDPQAIRDTLQILADRGVNTIGICLQKPGSKGNLFTPDGRPSDAATARQFTQLTALIRDHGMACVISLFSSDPACRLTSLQAYRQAAQEAARLLAVKHATVFVPGDLFGDNHWAPDSPCRLDDPAQVVELYRQMRKANEQVLVGIPANFIHRDANEQDEPFLYVADSPDTLTAFIAASPARNNLPKGIACVQTYQFHRFKGNPDPQALDRFLADVEKRRLAVKAPLPPAPLDAPAAPLTPEEKAEGFVPLFNGHNLDGWTTLRPDWSTWSVEDGTIKCAGAEGHWLRSRRRFASFILRCEFKIVKNGNSGIFVWSPLEARSSRFGMEMQIMGVQTDTPDDNTTGAIYGVLPPSKVPDVKINDWNTVEIACRGSWVRVTLNDRIIQDFDADEVPKLRGRLRRGFIGLQDHASPVWFRNIRIKELNAAR